MNKTSTAKTVCPYFLNDGKNFISCELGGKKLTLRLEPDEMKRQKERLCYTFGYRECPIAAANEKIYKP
ncbi:MAG: hypothetical protein J5756_04135 [Clostridia bacterium]|nr:hypothetical protein [Clostridia bacterium]